ncbi:MAG: hypothetical protein ACRENX_09555 [Candidatus Dormibacteria bacterium]
MLEEWARVHPDTTNGSRLGSLSVCLHRLTHDRAHTTFGGRAPVT